MQEIINENIEPEEGQGVQTNSAPKNLEGELNNNESSLNKSFFSNLRSTLQPPKLPNLDNIPNTNQTSINTIWTESLGLHKTIVKGLSDSFAIMYSKSKLLVAGTLIASAITASIPLITNKLSSLVPDLLSGNKANDGPINMAARWLASKYAEIAPAGFDMESGVAAAFLITAGVGFLNAKAGIANGISLVASRLFAPAVEREIRLELSKMNSNLPYEDLLSAQNKDRSSIISQGLWEFQSFFNSSLSCAINSVALAFVAISFFALEGSSYLGAGLIISAVPVFLSSTFRNIEKLWLERKIIYEKREAWQASGNVSDPEQVADFRHFRSLDAMRADYLDIDQKITQREGIPEIRKLWSDTLINSYRVIVSSGAALVALLYHVPGEPVSNVIYTLGMIAMFQGSLYGLVQEVTSLLNKASKLDPFYKLKQELSEKVTIKKTHLSPELFDQIPAIIVEGLKKSFPVTNDDGSISYQEVLDIPYLKIESGQTIGICGKIGSGKSVFTQLLSSRLIPTAGKVSWQYDNGELFDISEIDGDDIERINMRLQQGGYSYQRLTIRKILELSLNKNPNSKFTIEELMSVTNLDQVIRSAPNGLESRIGYGWIRGWVPSGGKAHVINLAQTLLSDCPIIILDEPTADLDAEQKSNFTNVIIPLMKSLGKTIIVISHTFGDLSYADRILVFDNGKIVDDGSPIELSQRPGYYNQGSLGEISRALLPFGMSVMQEADGSLKLIQK